MEEEEGKQRADKETYVGLCSSRRASASDVISPADRAASTAYLGSHHIITRKMAHYYHYYFIFPPLQRSPETTEKQKASEININKSFGHRIFDERYPKMERAKSTEGRGGKEAKSEGRRRRHTYMKKAIKRGGEEGR